MNHSQAQSIANKNNLGNVSFEWRVALNTGEQFEVGYVYVNGSKELFCKKVKNSDGFYLCNQFREIG